MDRDNKYSFAGQKVVFATQHAKEKILAPLFAELGLDLIAAKVDTDSLGTFSGEIERKGSVREVLRAKIQLALKEDPDHRFYLASEGSFAPHPKFAWLQSNIESLLLFDVQDKAEIYAEFVSTDVIHDEVEVSPTDHLDSFLKHNKFPSHGLLVRPADAFKPIYKGIHDHVTLQQAIQACAKVSSCGKIVLATDLRSHHSPTRQRVIYQAGEKLLQALKSCCPKCDYPGFSIVGSIAGLPCSECGRASRVAKEVLFECALCKYRQTSARPDGMTFLLAQECEFCNP